MRFGNKLTDKFVFTQRCARCEYHLEYSKYRGVRVGLSSSKKKRTRVFCVSCSLKQILFHHRLIFSVLPSVDRFKYYKIGMKL